MGKEEIETSELPDPDEKTLAIEYYVPKELASIYSDGASILHTENEFILSFFQTEYPPGIPVELMAEIDKISSKCVARILMSPFQMRRLVEALQVNLGKYEAKHSNEGKNDE